MKVLGQRIQMLFISKIIKMSKDRERRLKATGRFFQPPKKIKYLWLNNIFPVVLIISLLFLIFNL